MAATSTANACFYFGREWHCCLHPEGDRRPLHTSTVGGGLTYIIELLPRRSHTKRAPRLLSLSTHPRTLRCSSLLDPLVSKQWLRLCLSALLQRTLSRLTSNTRFRAALAAEVSHVFVLLQKSPYCAFLSTSSPTARPGDCLHGGCLWRCFEKANTRTAVRAWVCEISLR